MPTSSQRNIALHSQSILVLKDNTTISSDREKKRSSLSTRSTAVSGENIFIDDLQKFPKSRKRTRLRLIGSLVFLAFLILCVLTIVITLPLVFRTTTSTTTTDTTTIITTTVTTTTSTPNCVLPYALGLSGNCVNTLLDLNNCGTVSNICANTYTSCSIGVCSTVPVVQLTNATSIWTGGVNGSADDNILNVTLPFPITLYSTTTSHVQVTPNGVLCLGYCSNSWLETSLPSNSFGAAVFPYCDDLYIYAKTWQGIYLTTQGNAPSRTLVLEYYTSHYGLPNEFYHFQIVFFEASPGIVQFIYFDAYDKGATCTVGVQASGSGPFIQYASNQANSIQPNMTLTFNTILGSYTNSTIG